MANIASTVEELNSVQNNVEVVDKPAVRDRFIQIYETLWGEGTGAAAYEKESINFKKIVSESSYLSNPRYITPFSVFTSFIDLAVSGLSLEPGSRALCYLLPRKYKVLSANGGEAWEGRCCLTVSGYGEIFMRERAGQIAHADNPVLVYAEDEFTFYDKDGRKSVNYVCHLPHNSKQIVAGFMKITRNDGTIDYAVMFQEDWNRLKGYSEKNSNDNKANALYTSGEGGTIDTGFLMAKIIKHAFRTYPKVRIGKSTTMETEHTEEEVDYYGMEAETSAQPQKPEPKKEPQPEPFGGPANDMAQGAIIEPGDDGAF